MLKPSPRVTECLAANYPPSPTTHTHRVNTEATALLQKYQRTCEADQADREKMYEAETYNLRQRVKHLEETIKKLEILKEEESQVKTLFLESIAQLKAALHAAQEDLQDSQAREADLERAGSEASRQQEERHQEELSRLQEKIASLTEQIQDLEAVRLALIAHLERVRTERDAARNSETRMRLSFASLYEDVQQRAGESANNRRSSSKCCPLPSTAPTTSGSDSNTPPSPIAAFIQSAAQRPAPSAPAESISPALGSPRRHSVESNVSSVSSSTAETLALESTDELLAAGDMGRAIDRRVTGIYPVKVLKVNRTDEKCKVHYPGYKRTSDEWVPFCNVCRDNPEAVAELTARFEALRANRAAGGGR